MADDDNGEYTYVFAVTEATLRSALELVAGGMSVDSVMNELFLAAFSGEG